MREWNIYVLNRRMRTVNSMDDLISRDFIKSLQPEPDCVLTVWGDCSYAETGCSDCDIKAKITKALELFGNSEQSAQPEREKSEWILKKELVPLAWDCTPMDYDNYDEGTHCELKGFYHCSNCDWKSGEFKGGNFCPNCGTDMRGGQDEID